jgi:hypothetical protein
MKLGNKKLGIPAQIWAVLEVLASGDFTFYDLGIDSDTEARWEDLVDINTHPFYNLIGGASGFLFTVRKFSKPDNPVMFFTITQHSSSEEICVIDWIADREYGKLPLTQEGRPENARCANFAFADIGSVLDYVRRLIALYLTAPDGTTEFSLEGSRVKGTSKALYIKEAGVI